MLFWSKKTKNKERNILDDLNVSEAQAEQEFLDNQDNVNVSNSFAAFVPAGANVLESGCKYPLNITNQFPLWVTANRVAGDPPNLVDLIQEYYNWLTCGTKQNITPTFGFFELDSLTEVKQLPSWLLKLYSELYVPSLPADALDGDVSETELRSLINGIYNKLYTKKGSEYAFKYLIALFFDVEPTDVTIIYPKKYLMHLNAGANSGINSITPMTTMGRLNYSNLRDNGIWNEFSYIINVKNKGDTIDRTRFEKLIRPMLHPIGLKDYYQEQKQLFENISETTYFVVKEIPKINNYYFYDLFSTSDLPYDWGCTYDAPDNVSTHAFPTWSKKISQYPAGVSFGSININDFWELEPLISNNYPNNSRTCS